MSNRTINLLSGGALIALAWSGPALGQDAVHAGSSTATPAKSTPEPAAAQTATPAGQATLPDIIVTANKREQKLSNVGLTVDVLGGAALKSGNITTLQDIAQHVPSLSYASAPNGTPILTLRGVGFVESSLGAYPTVSSYIDEAPLPFGALTVHTAFDLQRIEVLKGPQGTLFGENSTGGAINYVTAKPTREFHAGLDVSYGRFNQLNAEGFVSGPLTDNLQARVAGRFEGMSGWQISQSRPDDRNGRVRNYMGRLLLAYQPASNVRLNLDINGWKDRSQPQAPQFVGVVYQQPVPDPVVASTAFSPPDQRIADWGAGFPNFRPYADNHLWQASLRADIDLSSSITLTSLTSYIDYGMHQANDGDGLPVSEGDYITNGAIKSFFQELRLGNGSAGRFRWLIGGNMERSSVDQVVDFDYSATAVHQTLLEFYGFDLTQAHYSSYQKMRNYAAFANGEFDIVPKLTLKAGARYTNTDTQANICNADLTGNPLGTGPFIYFLEGVTTPYQTGACFAGNDLGYTIGGVAPGEPGRFLDHLHQDNISWKTGLDYKPRRGLLFYVNVSQGYKGGGFPAVSATSFIQYKPVVQESVLAYEGGFKASLLGDTLQAEGAAFYYDYRDKQLRTKVLSEPYGIQDVLQNVPKSSVRGFEFELTMRPTGGLTVNTAFTYLDARIDKFVGINGAGVAADFSGTRMPFAPKYQVGTNLNYEFPLTNQLNGFVSSTLSFRSDTTSVVGGDTNPAGLIAVPGLIYRIPDYTLVDASIGIAGRNDRWRLSIFGKNIFNEYYWNNVVSTSDAISRFAGMPATYGVSLSLRM